MDVESLKVGDKIEVLNPFGNIWETVVLVDRSGIRNNDADDGKTHLQLLIERKGYKRLRIPKAA